jgi:hypothetical protein
MSDTDNDIERLPMVHRDGWTGPHASSAIPFAWFVWQHDHNGPTTLRRILWRAIRQDHTNRGERS